MSAARSGVGARARRFFFAAGRGIELLNGRTIILKLGTAVRPALLLDARAVPEPVDALVQLPFGELDLLACAVLVEQPVAHRDGDLIEVADLGEDVVGGAAEPNEAALFGERPTVPQPELLASQPPRLLDHLVAVARRNRRPVGKAGVVPILLGKPEPPHVLDAVEGDAAGDRVPLAEVLDRGDERLRSGIGEGHVHRQPTSGEGREQGRARRSLPRTPMIKIDMAPRSSLIRGEKTTNGAEECRRLLDIRYMAAVVDWHQLGAEPARRGLRRLQRNGILPPVNDDGR